MQPYLNLFPTSNGKDFGDGIAQAIATVSNPAQVDAGAFRLDYAVNSELVAALRLKLLVP